MNRYIYCETTAAVVWHIRRVATGLSNGPQETLCGKRVAWDCALGPAAADSFDHRCRTCADAFVDSQDGGGR